MANQLKMDTVQAIHVLHQHGWLNQRIAAELGIHRTTVAESLKLKPTGRVARGTDDGRLEPTVVTRHQRAPNRRKISTL